MVHAGMFGVRFHLAQEWCREVELFADDALEGENQAQAEHGEDDAAQPVSW
jgi:hypothetical protein